MSRGISLDVDLARQIGLAPAIVYNELLFWNKKGRREDGWIYKSYNEMTERLPLSERTIRDCYRKLEEAKLLSTKVLRVGEKPTLHYKFADSVSANSAETIESANSAEMSIYTKKNTIEDRSSAPKEKELLLLVNKITGRAFRTLPSKNVKKLLNTFSLVEISSALAALAADPWHNEKLKELGIDYLIRPTTIDKFLVQAEQFLQKPKVYINKPLFEDQDGSK